MGTDKNEGRSKIPESELTLIGLLGLIWPYRLRIAVCGIACGLMAFGVACLYPSQYTARVTLLPQQQNDTGDLLGRFSGLAALGLGDRGTYEALYGRIVASDRILDSLLVRDWGEPRVGSHRSIFDVFRIRVKPTSRDSLRAREVALGRLRRDVVVFDRDRLSGFMELRVTVPRDPVLAARLADCLAGLLDQYNRQFHRGKATEQREYATERLAQVGNDLVNAEVALADFLRANRGYDSSPDLLRRYGELRREVDAQTSIWIELRRQVEMARLDEQRQLVSVDILDRASIPVRRTSPQRGVVAVAGAVCGALGAICWGLWRDRAVRGN